MQLDPVHLVLGGIVILLVVVVAYLIGTRKTSDQPKSTAANSRDTNRKSEFVQVKPPAQSASQELKKDKKNPKYLSQIEEEWTSNTQTFSENCAKLLSVPYYERYNGLIEKFGGDEVEIGLDEMEEIITWFDIPSIKSGFENKIDEVAEIMTSVYTESVAEIAGVVEDNLTRKYVLSNDQKMGEVNKNASLLRKGFNQAYITLGEIHALQSKLQNQWPKYREIAESGEFDFGSIARNFGAGALAVINPFIGVPAVIASFTHDSKTEKIEKQIMESFSSNYQKYTEKLDEFDEVYTPIFERHISEIKLRADEQYLSRIMDCLYVLDEKGHSLRGVQKVFHKSWEG